MQTIIFVIEMKKMTYNVSSGTLNPIIPYHRNPQSEQLV